MAMFKMRLEGPCEEQERDCSKQKEDHAQSPTGRKSLVVRN